MSVRLDKITFAVGRRDSMIVLGTPVKITPLTITIKITDAWWADDHAWSSSRPDPRPFMIGKVIGFTVNDLDLYT